MTMPQQAAPQRRRIRIPTAELVNGWRQIIEVEVDWICPRCGAPRGQVSPAIGYDGRYQMNVDGWQNPCGHIDLYGEVEKESHSS
jgi:hypothetical protein